MNSPDSARIAKLPEWARKHIAHLENRIEDERRALVRLTGTTGEHYVEVRAGVTPHQRRFDDFSSVVFSLGGRRGAGRGDIEVRRVEPNGPGKGYALDICGLNGCLAIHPSSGNRVTIVEVER